MKRTIIILIIILIPVFTIHAGIRIGAKAGVNLSKADFNTNAIQTENFTGFQVGPIIEVSGITGFGLDAFILYSQHGFKIKTSKLLNHEQKVSSLDIPVNLKFKLSLVNLLGCYFTAGPYASFTLDDKVSFNGIKNQWQSKKFGVGLNFGAGIELVKSLQVGVNYQLALNDDYSNFSAEQLKGLNAKTRIWSITAAYFF